MKLLALILSAVLPGTILAAANSWPLASPDGRCEIRVSLNGEGVLTYQVSREGKSVILTSSLGLRRADEAFDHVLALQEAGKVTRGREEYELFGGVAPRIDHRLNRRSLTFKNANSACIILDLAASDEGVAFRYRFPETVTNVLTLESELTALKVSKAARGWLQPYHAASAYTPAYEDFYFQISPGDPPPHSRAKPMGWSFPALFHDPDAGSWLLLTESGTDETYCGCHLGSDSPDGNYRIHFAEANEATKGQTNSVGPEPRSTLPWTMPWRVIVLGKNAGEIATATLVTDLAPPSRVKDTSWIHPGRASWAWWAYPNGPNTVELLNRYTDFSKRMGWEYTLFDAGWWRPGLPALAKYAQESGVAPLAWMAASDFYHPARRNAKLDEVQSAGVRGIKVDFWCSDRQEAMAAMQSLFAEAASRRLVVNLHGCTIPRGWERTWPNLLTVEAVLGTESYFYESRYTEKAAELNTVLPFTRNAVGPMDVTPVACSPKQYARTTTAAHELATAIILKSGLIHYADKPEFFESLPPEMLQVLRDAPARWDETRCLLGEPGRVAVFARRAGKSWFIAGLNGTDQPLPVALDLSAFHAYHNRLAITEGADPIMEVAVTRLDKSSSWQHEMPARGGFILRLDKP